MENTSFNFTYDQESLLRHPGVQVAFLLAVLLLVAIGIFDILVITVLALERKVAVALRVYLINLLVANTLVALTEKVSILSMIVFASLDIQDPSPIFCRLLIWTWAVASLVRSFSLTTFSLAVALIGRYGITCYRTLYIVITLCTVWLAAVVIDVYVLVPQTLSVKYLEGYVCYPSSRAPDGSLMAGFYLNTLWWLVGGAIPITASVVISLVAILYVKYCKRNEGTERQGSLAKFPLFLLFGNIVNFIAILLPVVLNTYNATVVGSSITSGLITLTLIPTPILVVVFLKPIRVKMRKVLSRCCCLGACSTKSRETKKPIQQMQTVRQETV